MSTEYIASKDNNKVSAATAKEAVALFLKTYRNQTFTVKEYRNGCFKTTFGLGASKDTDPENNYFYRHFANRKEAQQFIAQQPAFALSQSACIHDVVEAARRKFGEVMKVIKMSDNTFFVACKRRECPLADLPYMTITAQKEDAPAHDTKPGIVFSWGHYDLTVDQVYAAINEATGNGG